MTHEPPTHPYPEDYGQHLRATLPIVEYLRRQGGQHNRQQPIVPVAGSELVKAADTIEQLYEACERMRIAYTGDWLNCESAIAQAEAALAKARGEQ